MAGSGSTADETSKVSGYPVGGADEGSVAENSHVRTLLPGLADEKIEARRGDAGRQAQGRNLVVLGVLNFR